MSNLLDLDAATAQVQSQLIKSQMTTKASINMPVPVDQLTLSLLDPHLRSNMRRRFGPHDRDSRAWENVEKVLTVSCLASRLASCI